jgi:hypothetical protein
MIKNLIFTFIGFSYRKATFTTPFSKVAQGYQQGLPHPSAKLLKGTSNVAQGHCKVAFCNILILSPIF